MKLTIQPTLGSSGAVYPTVSVEHPSNNLAIEEFLEVAVRPALIAWGFSAELVDQHLNPE